MRDEFSEEVYTQEEFDEAQQEHEDEIEQLKWDHEQAIWQLERDMRQPLWKDFTSFALHVFAGGVIGIEFLHWNWWLSWIFGFGLALLLD